MVMGHYATALVPFHKLKGAPIWLLLLCAQLGDVVWLLLALAGIESPSPPSFLDVTIIGLKVTMPWSHTGLDSLLMALLTAGLVQLVWKSRQLTLWCAALVLGHWLCDLLCGWKHEILVPGTPMIGLDLYSHSPYVAFAIETVFAAALVAWFIRARRLDGHSLSPRVQAALYGVFAGGSAMLAPTAYSSLRSLLGG